MVENTGILLRGKSLKELKKISDKFTRCYIVNDFKRELGLVEKQLKDKEIHHFVNSMSESSLQKKQYKNFGIKSLQFSFTESTAKKNKGHKKKPEFLRNHYTHLGLTSIQFLPESHEKITRSIRNTGLCCVSYVSEFIQPSNIWIAGLDFYESDYLVKKNFKYQVKKAKTIKMVGSFVNIVKKHPHITYHLASYHHKKLLSIENLKLL
jgi:hypothetical protein